MKTKLTKEIIDLLVPYHTVLRYHDEVICSDENHVGGLDYTFADKEWRCKRCVLLDLVSEDEYDDYLSKFAEVRIEVYGIGNVR